METATFTNIIGKFETHQVTTLSCTHVVVMQGCLTYHYTQHRPCTGLIIETKYVISGFSF